MAPLPHETQPTAPLDPRDVETCSELSPPASAATPRVRSEGPNAGPPALGRIGRFELRAVLGQGTFGRVYRAYDSQLERLVALKVPKFGSDEPHLVERFLEEARAAARLRHPNIVAVFESGQAGDDYYIASELVEGKPLSAHLLKGGLNFQQAARWVRDLATGLAFAHEAKVVHRDIKPANILIDRQGRPQLTDFGLAKRVGEDATRTADGTVLGTPAYMAPEQARGDLAAVGPHSDQYSLGVVLYELLTGRRPFDGSPHVILAQVVVDEPPPPSRFRAGIPRDLEAICLKAMAKEPARRYGSAADLAADLERFLAGEPVRARLPGLLERTRRWLWRYRQPVLLASGIAAAVLLTLGAVWWNGGFQPPLPQETAPAAQQPELSPEEQQRLEAERTAEQQRREVERRMNASRMKLITLGRAMASYHDFFGYLPQHAICNKDGKPLLSWRVAMLPYVGHKLLYEHFKLDEPWDSPHNLELSQQMPDVFEVPGVATPRPYMTFYQVLVGPGAAFEADPKRRIRLTEITDGPSTTLMIVEAGEAVEWTRPEDLPFEPGKPLPRLGGVVADGFNFCYCNGSVDFLKKEIYEDDKTLRALIGRNDGVLVNLRPYQRNPYQQATPRPGGDTARQAPREPPKEVPDRAAALESGRKENSKNNLRQLGLALRKYHNTHGILPPPAIYSKDGSPLLSWRVAVLPFLQQDVLYQKFKLEEPWDSPTNQALLQYMPPVFEAPGTTIPELGQTFYQIFVGPGAFEPGAKRRTLLNAMPDGASNTIAIAEAARPVPWTKPEDLSFSLDGPLPRLGGPFADGFHAAFFDGSALFFKKEIYQDEKTLRALIGWNDGEVVNLRPYLEPTFPKLSKDSPGFAPTESSRRTHSAISLRQLAIAFHNYHSTKGRLPSYAIHDKNGRPLLSWRVELLPFLDQRLLYEKFKRDEPWDSPHNLALLPLMPRLFDMAARAGDDPTKTFYQVFVGPGAAFERDPQRTVRFADITDGTSNTILIVEAGAVPWTKPEDLFFEADQPLPRPGGFFADGFNACTADSSVRFLSNGIGEDEKTMRALIGIRDGVRVDLNALR
jgi:hypothetical protein